MKIYRNIMTGKEVVVISRTTVNLSEDHIGQLVVLYTDSNQTGHHNPWLVMCLEEFDSKYKEK